MNAVARKVVRGTSVYLHFATVEQLKVAVARRGFAQLNEYRDAASHGITDPCRRCWSAVGRTGGSRWTILATIGSCSEPACQRSFAYTAEHAPRPDALQSLAASIQRCQPNRAAPPGRIPNA